MKRIWIGLGLLGFLLGISLLTARKMASVHTQVAHRLEQAAETESFQQAAQWSREAETAWRHHCHFTASLTDHANIDQIDGLFAQLQVYRQAGNTLSHATTCAYLAEMITALQEAHRLTWWNLL